MSGASDATTGLSVTSWGWEEVEGEQWRTWRVLMNAKVIAMITLPTHDSYEALVLACDMFRDQVSR